MSELRRPVSTHRPAPGRPCWSRDALAMAVDDRDGVRFGARLRHAREASRLSLGVDTLITPADERHVTVLESAVAAGGSGGAALYTLPSECEGSFILQVQVEVQVEGG